MSRALLFAFDRDPLVDFSEVFFSSCKCDQLLLSPACELIRAYSDCKLKSLLDILWDLTLRTLGCGWEISVGTGFTAVAKGAVLTLDALASFHVAGLAVC